MHSSQQRGAAPMARCSCLALHALWPSTPCSPARLWPESMQRAGAPRAGGKRAGGRHECASPQPSYKRPLSRCSERPSRQPRGQSRGSRSPEPAARTEGCPRLTKRPPVKSPPAQTRAGRKRRKPAAGGAGSPEGGREGGPPQVLCLKRGLCFFFLPGLLSTPLLPSPPETRGPCPVCGPGQRSAAPGWSPGPPAGGRAAGSTASAYCSTVVLERTFLDVLLKRTA